MHIKRFSSGSKWEGIVGYSRAVKAGPMIEIAGTVAVDDRGKIVGPGNPYEQARYILGKIMTYVGLAGGKPEDVVRTRIYLTNISHWERVAKAHGEVFGKIRPVTTMVEVSALISPEYLVEIEATAVVPEDSPPA
jgi:enamine deaminase RidA (YjgF/YER057c/UK114 family)